MILVRSVVFFSRCVCCELHQHRNRRALEVRNEMKARSAKANANALVKRLVG